MFSRETAKLLEAPTVRGYETPDGDSFGPQIALRALSESASGLTGNAFSTRINHAGDRPGAWPGTIAATLLDQTVGLRQKVLPAHPYGQHRTLRNLWHRADERNEFGPEISEWNRIKEQSAAVVAAAGGAGATTVAATLARLYARQQEGIAIVDGRPQSALPLYFGGKTGVYAGQISTTPDNLQDAPIHIVNTDASEAAPRTNEAGVRDSVEKSLLKLRGDVARALVDVWPASLTGDLAEFFSCGVWLIVAVPDPSSILGIQKIRDYHRRANITAQPVYVLNKFDRNQPLHTEIRDWLARHNGGHELVSLRASDEVSEALADGMTILDYAPDSGLAEDYYQLGSIIHKRTGTNAAGRRA